MGFYLQTPVNKGKAKYLIDHHDAQLLLTPVFLTGDKIAVCVVDNGPFEAAGVAFSAEEMAVFMSPDSGPIQRPRVFLKVPRSEVIKLCPKVEARLPK